MGTKFYENPQRAKNEQNRPAYTPYVPQYKLHGIEQEDMRAMNDRRRFNTSNQALLIKGKPNLFEQNSPAPISRNVPFAEVPTNDHPKVSNMPNVGNNIENTWAGLDGEVIDDIGLNEYNDQSHMIDNNDYVEIDQYAQSPSAVIPTPAITIDSNVTAPILQNDEYLLAIDGTIIATGSFDFIENEVKALVFGDHQLCKGKAIPADDLTVLKKIQIKVGVFING